MISEGEDSTKVNVVEQIGGPIDEFPNPQKGERQGAISQILQI